MTVHSYTLVSASVLPISLFLMKTLYYIYYGYNTVQWPFNPRQVYMYLLFIKFTLRVIYDYFYPTISAVF